MNSPITVRTLPAQPITSDGFRPYGQVVTACPDGKLFDLEDAQLQLSPGTPRFYIMRLHKPGRVFSRITRHQRCTQCLGALGGKDWLIAVAPPSATPEPDLSAISAFRIPGDCFIKLEVGTWHAGPYFEHDVVDFYNLELSDTNIVDHDTYDLRKQECVEFEIIDS